MIILTNYFIRAFDCLNNDSYVDANVNIDVIEPCVPQWTDYPTEIVSHLESTNLFEQIQTTICPEIQCKIAKVNAKLELLLDNSIKNNCKIEECVSTQELNSESEKIVIFSNNKITSNADDDSIEDEYEDENKIKNENKNNKKIEKKMDVSEPLNYQSFSKLIENAQKIEFDGKFGNSFQISVWLRRPKNADKSIKEQIFCGSDSLAMNRHHFGLYFYRSSLKFLMRKENSPNNKADVFYPSLWEWLMPETILNDGNWHYYEIRINYPDATLFIDGKQFEENKTNSDIIDAFELSSVTNTGLISTYVGACYHARTKSLIDHFEGDIGDIILKKNIQKSSDKRCKKNCQESIEINMIGNEIFYNSIEILSSNEILIHTTNLNDLSEILRKINYINKNKYPDTGNRIIQLITTLHCADSNKEIKLNDLKLTVNVRREKHEYNIQLEGDKTLIVNRGDIENGIEPFKDISIFSYEINKIDDALSNEDEDSAETKADSIENTDDENDILLSKCQIKIFSERNLMEPKENNEKVMFLQNLLDQFGFEFKETNDYVYINGISKAKNYESFIRRLTYVTMNSHNIENSKFLKSKQFFVSCIRNDPIIETNTIIVQLNIVIEENKETITKASHSNHQNGFIAHKQAERLIVSEADDDLIVKKVENSNIINNKNTKYNTPSPLAVALIALCVCGIGFFLIFGAVRLYTNGYFNKKRKALPNEENPHIDGMEWDDSGLNITENPLDKLEGKQNIELNINQNLENQFDDDEEYSSNGEEYEDEYENQYSSDEELTEKVANRELEWDDTSIGIKLKDKQLKNSSNNLKVTEYNVNKFV